MSKSKQLIDERKGKERLDDKNCNWILH